MKRYRPWARLYHATRYSLAGLVCAFRQEQAFEYEAFVLAILVAVVFFVELPVATSLALVGCWLIVMAFELVNSALEKAFDLIDENYNILIKEGKDMLSAAVFLGVLFNMVLWAACIVQYCITG